MSERPPPIAAGLPEHWPTTPAVEPVRPWWIPWPIAVLAVPLLWILPKRMGPHFAAVRWPGIIAAHLLWTLYGICCIYLTLTAPEYGWIAWLKGDNTGERPAYAQMTFSQTVRAPVAQVVWDLCKEANFGGGWGSPEFPEIGSVVDLLLWLAIVVGTEIALAVPALLLMPYIAAGERSRRLFWRSLKITFLCTTLIFPVSLAIQWGATWRGRPVSEDVAITVLVAAACAWFCWIWIRAGMLYSGPAEGPGWEPWKVLCENCGYSLTGQQLRGHCPECGQPVSYSMPAGRRPTPLAAARGHVSAVSGFLITYSAAVTKGDFFKRIPVHADLGTARRFAIWSSIVFFPLAVLITVLCMSLVFEREDVAREVLSGGTPRVWIETHCMVASFWVFTSIGLLLILGGVAMVCSWGGRKPVRERAVVVFYWSATILTLYAAISAATTVAVWIYQSPRLARTVNLGQWGNWDWCVLLAPVPYIVLAVPALIITGKRLARGIAQTRYANG